MTEVDELFQKVQKLEEELWSAKDTLKNSKDGFYYKVTYWKYRVERHIEFNNSYCLQEFIEDSADGENYIIVKLETNNPNWKDWSSGYEKYHQDTTEESTKEYYDYSGRRPRRLRRPMEEL